MLAFQRPEDRRKYFSIPGRNLSNAQSAFGEKTSHCRDTGGLFTHHWNNSSNTQSAFGEETSRLDSLLSSLSIVNVPGDGSCLFWAACLAYLFSISEDQLEEACMKLFGKEWSIGVVKKMMQDAELSKLPKNYKDSSNSVFFSLIQSFRQQVVKHMSKTLSPDTTIEDVPLNTHLEKMLNSMEWGGREEVQAISDLLGCKISVINSWDKNLEHIDTFGSGSPHLCLILKSKNYFKHYFIGLQKANIRRLSPALIATNQVLELKRCNRNTKSTNVSNALKVIGSASNLKDIWNKPPNIQQAAPVPSAKQSSEVYLEQINKLRELEVLKLIDELTVLEEIEELEEEIQEIAKSNKINVLAPFQGLHPLNFFTPYTCLKKLIKRLHWLKPAEFSKINPILEARIKVVRKVKEVEEMNKNIALLRKLIERREKEWLSIEEEIKQPELPKVEKQMAEIKKKIEYFIVKLDKEVEYRIAKQNGEKTRLFSMLKEEREKQMSIRNGAEIAIESQKACLAKKDLIRTLGIETGNLNKVEDVDEILYCIDKLESDSKTIIDRSKSVLKSTGYESAKAYGPQKSETLEQKIALEMQKHHRAKLEAIDEIQSLINELRDNIEKINTVKSLLENTVSEKLNDPQKSALLMLKEKIALQQAYLGLKRKNFSVVTKGFLDNSIIDETLNIYVQEWRERNERIRYFTELPFVEGASHDDSLRDNLKDKELRAKIIVTSSLIAIFGTWVYLAYMGYHDMLTA